MLLVKCIMSNIGYEANFHWRVTTNALDRLIHAHLAISLLSAGFQEAPFLVRRRRFNLLRIVPIANKMRIEAPINRGTQGPLA